MRRPKSACRRTSWRLFDDDPAELEAGGPLQPAMNTGRMDASMRRTLA